MWSSNNQLVAQIQRTNIVIDLVNETPLSLMAAARMLPPGRRGKPVTISCIFRWIADGVRAPGGERIRLEALRAGGRWITTAEALQRFMDRQTPRFDDAVVTPRTPERRRRACEQASKRLEALGI